jgi:hypothetical protein
MERVWFEGGLKVLAHCLNFNHQFEKGKVQVLKILQFLEEKTVRKSQILIAFFICLNFRIFINVA